MTRGLVTLAGALGASLLALKFATVPYVWIFAAASAASGVWIATARSDASKLVAVNLAAAFVALAGVEAHFAGIFAGGAGAAAEAGEPVEYDAEYFRRHDVLGSAPRKGVAVTATKSTSAGTSYRVTYTIDSLGLRRPPPDVRSDAPCVLFFGGSFTFGEGVEDEEAMPWVVGVLSGYRPFNFGFHGYGPHQMLAALEEGLVAEAVADCRVRAVIYQAIADHTARSAGMRSWGRHGPRYRLLPDGGVRRDGHFDDPDPTPTGLVPFLAWKLGNQLEKSRILARIFPEKVRAEEHLALFVAIVHSSRRLAQAAWPGASFHVLLWENTFGDQQLAAVLESLGREDIPVHFVSDILPPLPEGESYVIANDGHPNGRAHRALAEYVVTQILPGGAF
jgi:hypothetical protein